MPPKDFISGPKCVIKVSVGGTRMSESVTSLPFPNHVGATEPSEPAGDTPKLVLTGGLGGARCGNDHRWNLAGEDCRQAGVRGCRSSHP